MQTTPRAMRLHIGIFGKTNVGKSTLINVLTGQDIAITSEHAGTTTDAVEKSMELQPLGPVTFIDTAGIDDNSELGKARIEKTLQIIPPRMLTPITLLPGLKATITTAMTAATSKSTMTK